jgi:parvulin-like peptidyl-prolyl isomerase
MFRWRFIVRAVGGLSAAVLLLAAGPEPSSTDVVAQAGTTVLTVADVQQMLGHLDPGVRQKLFSNSTAMAEFVRTRLVQQELLDEAKAKKLDQDPDVAYRAKMAYDAVIADSYLASLTKPDAAYPSDADVQTAYDANKTRFVIPRQYHLAQIFLAVPQNSPQDMDNDAQKQLRELKQTLSKPRGDFAETAKRVSQDKASFANGGDLGWVREDQLAPAIKDAVAGLPEKGVSDPVRLPDGWHLVKMLGTKPAATAPLADVKEQIVAALRQQKAQDNARAYLQQMQRQEPIALNEITLARIVAH